MGDFAPFTAPLEKALRLKSMIDDIAFRREQREQSRQAFQMHVEQTKRANQMQDFQTAMTLGQMGGIQATPQVQGLEQGLDAAVGPVTPESRKPLMKTPVGDYYVPTAEQREDKATDRAIEKAGKLKDATDPVVTIDVRGKPVRVRQSQLDNILPKLYPDARMDKTVNKETGDVTKVWYDGQGNELKRVVEPGVGGRASAGAGREALPDRTAIEKYMNDWRGTVYRRLGITDQEKALADGSYQFPQGMLEGEKAELRKAATDKIAKAEREVERMAADQAKADIRNQGGSQTPAQVAVSATDKSVRASSLQAELERGNAERKRLGKPPFTMQEFRKKLTERGFTIDEKN